MNTNIKQIQNKILENKKSILLTTLVLALGILLGLSIAFSFAHRMAGMRDGRYDSRGGERYERGVNYDRRGMMNRDGGNWGDGRGMMYGNQNSTNTAPTSATQIIEVTASTSVGVNGAPVR